MPMTDAERNTWETTRKLLSQVLQDMVWPGMHFNERYLHHRFSSEVLRVSVAGLGEWSPASGVGLHPEWPTYKSATAVAYGRYRKVKRRYRVDANGTGGAIDFTIGDYSKPIIGVEFKYGLSWNAEGNTFDYMKLLDARNPFEAVAQVTVLRRRGVTLSSGKQALAAMDDAYATAMARLKDGGRPRAKRTQWFVVVEVAKEAKRFWLCDSVGGKFRLAGDALL